LNGALFYRRLPTADRRLFFNMRKLLAILAVLALLVAAMAIYLVATTPKSAEPLRFPLSDAHRELLRRVPASADSFALIPAAALLRGKLLANPVTGEPVLEWEEEYELPRAWMLGGADIVAWRSGKATSYAVRFDPFRAFLARMWLMMATNAPARWDGNTLVMNDLTPSTSPADLDDILRLASGLPEGDAFVVQWNRARGAYPPIGRPAVTSLRVSTADIVIVSRAASDDFSEQHPVRARFPRGAMLAVTFANPPRLVSDLNRLLGAKVDLLVDDGGSIALYGVDTGTFIPRPKGIIAIPADEHGRAAIANVARVAEIVGETRDTGSELLVSFDRTSLGQYSADTFLPATWPASQWAMRVDPAHLVPVLRRLHDSTGLRIVAPRIHRGVRDLRGWTDALDRAGSIEAAASVTAGVEELRVRVASK
jgi:hypothetical protein